VTKLAKQELTLALQRFTVRIVQAPRVVIRLFLIVVIVTVVSFWFDFNFSHYFSFFSGRLFLPTVRVRLEEKKEDAAALIVVVDERLESCLAEKILELAQIRPIFRFTLLAHHITVEHLDALLQFGKGKCFEPCVKIRLERSAHPVNESLVAIELEEEPREGMTIPFPTQFKAELDCLFRDNRAQLEILGPDISFLRYKSRPVIF